MLKRLFAIGLFAAVTAACVGTTGSGLVTFKAFGAGPADVTNHQLSFVNGKGWNITLTKATLHVGALYLNRSVPVSGGQTRSCYETGVYVAQVLDGADLDLLNPAEQPFPSPGSGTADPAATGEVWLTGGRVDDEDDRTIIADVEGTATKGVTSMRFEGTITIGRNRVPVATNPALPGANPVCLYRIVTPIAVNVTPQSGGSLVVRADPRGWFANVDLGALAPVTATSDLRRFADDSSDEASANLFAGLRAAEGVYTFAWHP